MGWAASPCRVDAMGPSADNPGTKSCGATTMLPAPGFHHLHLNSVDPEAAIDFYVRLFPRSTRARWAGLPALAAPNDVLVLFTRVTTPPTIAPQSALWHFGWHVTDTRASLAGYQGR